MALTLEKLIQNRKDLIEAHRKNNFTDGIHALLTDLYPDTAHFIYELLQNAEDMDATIVRFILDENGIDFEHNGIKRSFNIDDIDAITNIGNNIQKKDDPTSIGKFGVGFKSVFAYTSTPTIHSGEYHFEIHDYFVPVFEGVKNVKTVDPYGVAWTKFSFPFNNPNKPKNLAYRECYEGLLELDANAVLFLQNIKRIEYMLPSSDMGIVERTDAQDNHVLISCKKPSENQNTDSRWLKFFRYVDMADDHGRNKHLPIAIAFAMKNDSKSKKDAITPVTGRTFIYFPAEKEYSGLKFHINAPFASTVARDGVRECSDNVKLIKAISNLLIDSLPLIKNWGLISHSLFETLPNKKDDLSEFYSCIVDDVIKTFHDNEYLMTKDGKFTTAIDAMRGPTAISNLFTENDLLNLLGIQKRWINNATLKNSRLDYFFQSVGAQVFGYEEFSDIFRENIRNKIEELLCNKDCYWMKNFYSLCLTTYDNISYNSRHEYCKALKCSKIIRSTTGKMYMAEEIYILPPYTTLVTKSTPVVDQLYVLGATKDDETANKIKTFFRDNLDIKYYGVIVEIKKKLERYTPQFHLDETYFSDLLLFARLKSKDFKNDDKDDNEEYEPINFGEYPLFAYLDVKTDKIRLTYANKLVLGKKYGFDIGEELASVRHMNCLWEGYADKYTEDEIHDLVSFAEACGIVKGLTIEKQRAKCNPMFYSKLNSEARSTGYGKDYDYYIPALEQLLKTKSMVINKLIWHTIEIYGRNYKGSASIYNSSAGGVFSSSLTFSSYGKEYIEAAYSPNASATIKRCDSSLIYYLKEYEWIPDKHGGSFHRPEDISINDLHEDFEYDPTNTIMKALCIGSKEGDKKRELDEAKSTIEANGFHVVTDEDYSLLIEAKKKRSLKKTNEGKKILPVDELFEKQNKQAKTTTCTKDNSKYPSKEVDVGKTFKNAKKMKPIPGEIFSRIKECTKEERKKLEMWYHGECQMCGMKINKYDGQPYFVAKNIISMHQFPDEIRATNVLAWNSLCLCPNCAVRYGVCSRDLNGLYEQILDHIVLAEDKRVFLTIELENRKQKIQYTKEHFLILKKAIQIIDKEAMKKTSLNKRSNL